MTRNKKENPAGLNVVASNDIDPEEEIGWGEPWDFHAPIVAFAIEIIEAGRFSEDRPEDRVARKLADKGFSSLTDDEIDISNERLVPLVDLYFAPDRETFEAEFTRRRAPGFYDKPEEDDGQGELF